MDKIPDLVSELERAGGDVEAARALVREVLEFHREGLVRLLDVVPKEALAEAARDPLVASLLDLHDIEAPKPAILLPAKGLVRKKADPVTHDAGVCELCSAPAPGRHPHLVDRPTGAILCACPACALLAHAKYAVVPDRPRRAEGLDGDDTWWKALGLPSGVAFFVPRTNGGPRVYYPGAVGAMEAEIAAEAWRAAEPSLPALAPDVEALLVDRADGAREHWVVGVDRCWEFVALVRANWRGFTGGPEARAARERFFAALAREAA